MTIPRAREFASRHHGALLFIAIIALFAALYLYSLTYPADGPPPPYPDWHVDAPGPGHQHYGPPR